MKDECRYCGSERTVPVLDVRMEGQPHGGNPYRTLCLGCSRWLTLASKQAFKNHLRPHVLPKDADPESDDCTIPLEDWDRSERFQELRERIENYRGRDRPYALVTDGSGDVDDEDVQDDVDEEPINRFDCPKCDVEVTGKPDECPDCGAPYNW